MKNPKHPIGNNRELPACSAVLQPTAPPRTHSPLLEKDAEVKYLRTKIANKKLHK
jgi:hypothetical protein